MPAVAYYDHLADLVGENSEFAFNLCQNLRDVDGNPFYSPYSISLTLAMTYAGARGETERQMTDTLRHFLSLDKLHPAFNVPDMELASRGEGAQGKDDEGFRFNIVNAVWGQDGCTFALGFLDTLALKSGDVDLVWQLSPQSVPGVDAHPETTVLNATSFSHLAVCIPTNVPPFDNKLVRKAMQAATDREGINQAALLGLGIPARDHPIHPSHPAFASQYAPPDYDPELARSLLEQAGYPDGIDLTLYTSDIGPALIELAVAYKESAAPAGIRIDVERTPSEAYWSEHWNNGKLASVYWFGFMPDQALARQIHSDAPFNCPRYFNPVVDELIEKARGQDLEGQKESYGEIQRILIDDVPRLIIVFQPWMYGVNKDLRGLAPHPRGFPIIQDAWFDR